MQQTFSFDNSLSAEQIDFYHKYGFLHFKQFISRENIALFISEINHISKKIIEERITKVNGVPLKFGETEDGEKIIQRLAFASNYSAILHDFLKDDRFKSLQALLGNFDARIGENEKDGLVVNHYENTLNSKFKNMGWHTDSPRDLFLGSRIMPMLNVGLHLDDYPASNGGLRIIPGTHRQNLFNLLFRKKYFIDNKPDREEVGFDINAGDLTIHNGKLWHRVQQSALTGVKSRRRVMYIPIITGKFQYKHAESKTPFYHRLAQLQTVKLKLS